MFLLAHDVSIAFIYFEYKKNPSAVDLVGSLLKQLLQQGMGISPAIRDLYAKHISISTPPSLDELSGLLVSASRSFSRLYMVVDALDECPTGTDTKVLSVLRKLSNLHLLVTSRAHVDVSSNLNAVRLDIRADNQDMEVFIRGRIDEDQKLRRYVPAPSKETFITKIIEKSDGM